MRRPDNGGDPTVERELEAIEAALRAGRADAPDPVERELQELALALSADAPAPRPAFGEKLERRVVEGFPRAKGGGGASEAIASPRLGWLSKRVAGRSAPRLPRRLLPALAAAATLLVALAVSLPLALENQDASITSGSLGDSPTDGAARRSLEGESAPSMTRGLPPSVPSPGSGGRDFAPGSPERSIERSADLTLAAPADDLDRLASEVAEVTDRHRGFVLRSSVTRGEDAAGGSFELRIPTSRLRDALRDLSSLGNVRSRSESGEDVTRAVVGAGDRLEAASAERRSLLRRLEGADGSRESEPLRRRLDSVAREISALRAQLRDLRLRADYAAVTVSLTDDDAGSATSGGNSTTDALHDALASLQSSLNFLLRALGVVLPVGLVALAAVMAGRAFRRRRRESALV